MLAAGFALFVVGCSTQEPSVAVPNKVVKLSDGKYYSVPVGSSYTQEAVSAKVIKRYQEFGVSDCQEGDITWEDQKVANAINKVMREGSKSEGLDIYRKAAGEGKIGCASPLSDEEYQASLKQ